MPLSTADRWYDLEELAQGVTLIRESHVEEIARSNIWVVKGSEFTLVIDTGTGVGPLRTVVESVTDRPIIAFATLGYYDHAGGLHQFDRRAIHRLDAHRVECPSPKKVASERYVGWAFKALPYPGFNPEQYTVPPSAPTRIVNDGDKIKLGDRQLEAVHLPGITPGTCGLFERSSGLLFTGDALSYDRGYVYDGEPPDYSSDADRQAFRASLSRMRSLPASWVLPGHFAPFDGHRLATIIDDYLAGRTRAEPVVGD